MPVVKMYTLSTCPWCRKAKQWFTERNIPFVFTDYDLSDAETKRQITAEMDAAGCLISYVQIGERSWAVYHSTPA